MRYSQLFEAGAPKDPNKMLALRLWSDGTVPLHKIGALGRFNPNNPADTEKLAKLWYDTLQQSFSSTDALNVTRQPEYKSLVNWLTDRYIRGDRTYEDATSQVADTLAAWLRLKYQPNISELLGKPYPTDINQFSGVNALEKFMQQDALHEPIKKLKNRAAIERAKRTAREIVLLDNDRFKISIPLNFGACYVFNNEVGYVARYCTGSSSGMTWFTTYAKNGLMIDILDKERANTINGKWQIHATSGQMQNATQQGLISHDGKSYRPDQYFALVYPGLLKRIAALLHDHADEIKSQTGHSADTEIKNLESKFPLSYNSVEGQNEIS